MKRLILIISFLALVANLLGQEIGGIWTGTLDVGVAKMRLVVNIDKSENGYKATLDSPDQGAKGIAVSTISYQDNTLDLEVATIQMKYKGKVLEDSIVGIFSQGGQEFPLILKKGIIQLHRPQEPKPPYSYYSEEVKFYNEDANINLAGTFTYPTEGSGFPVVVLITGSGPLNRDEELFGHKPFLVLTDHLTNNGIAVLRFDKRGVGESEGSFREGTTHNFATDVYAGIEYLKTRKEIDKSKIGLIGHSEGGLISFILASQYPEDISFIVSMAGPGVDGKEIIRLQSKQMQLAEGVHDSVATENQKIALTTIQYIEKYEDEYLRKNIESIMREILPEDKQTHDIMRNLANSIANMSSPWFREYLLYNPQKDLQKVFSNILAINGGKDCQVDADVNLKAIEDNLQNAKSVKINKYPNLNHLFQNAGTGGMSEYQQIEETIALEVLKDIGDWIYSVTK